jgi:hypothetical protein
LGIKDLAGTPTLNAVSIFVSENGWKEGELNAMAIYGGGGNTVLSQLTTTDPTVPEVSSFSFTAGSGGNPNLTLEGQRFGAGSSVQATGSITSGATPHFDISLTDGGTIIDINGINGSGDLASAGGMTLPETPAITPLSNFTGVYGGSLAGTIDSTSTAITGKFNIGLNDLQGSLNVNRAEVQLQSAAFDLTVKGNTGVGSFGGANALDNLYFGLEIGNATVVGPSAVDPAWNLSGSGSISGNKMSVTMYPNAVLLGGTNGGTVTGIGEKDKPVTIP